MCGDAQLEVQARYFTPPRGDSAYERGGDARRLA